MAHLLDQAGTSSKSHYEDEAELMIVDITEVWRRLDDLAKITQLLDTCLLLQRSCPTHSTENHKSLNQQNNV